MSCSLGLGIPLLLFPVGLAPAAAAGPDTNAALKYWQAFTTLPGIPAAEHARITADCQTMPLDGQARGVVTQARYALLMMHRGAASPRCDWAIGWADEGFGNRLPHLDGARLLSALACLRARQRFEDGQTAEAVGDVLAALAMGRHVSRDGSLPAVLTGYAVERRMGETLAHYLPTLDAGAVKDLQQRLAALPPGGTLASGVREEQILETGWFVRKVKESKDGESLLALLSQIWGRDEGRALLKDCGGTAAGVIKHAEELLAWYPALAGQMDLRPDRFEEEQDRAAAKLAGNPMYKKLAPPILRCRWLRAQADVRRGLLSAAIEVQLAGRDALKNHPDPVVGGPFEYLAVEGGFKLRSRWVPDATLRAKRNLGPEPLVLVVGRTGK